MSLTRELPGLTRLHEALEHAGFSDMLELQGPYTLFAPLDGDLNVRATTDTGSALPSPDSIRLILSFHIVRGLISGVHGDSLTVSSLAEVPMRLATRRDGVLSVEGRRVLQTIEARNGVLHVIPNLLTLPYADTTDTLEANGAIGPQT